jgi:ABC-type multidrug transport system ATPase subunit
LYSHRAFWFSQLVVEVPELIGFNLMFSKIMQVTVGFHGDETKFHIISALISLAGYAMLAALSWLSDTELSSLASFSMLCSFQVLLGGFLVAARNLDPYLRWMINISFPYWGIGQLIKNDFDGYKNGQGNIVVTYYGYDKQIFWVSCAVLAGVFVTFQLVVFSVMRPRPKNVEIIAPADPRRAALLSLLAQRNAAPRDKPRDAEETAITSMTTIAAQEARSSSVPCSISFSKLNHTLKNGDRMKHIITDVSGNVQPSEMLAIMGSSGSGKTTLLNVIAGRVNQGKTTGSVTANAAPFLGFRQRNTASLASRCAVPDFAYVMQDDVHIPCLTVRETLEFAAMLRLRVPQRSDARVQEAVARVMRMLSLTKIADNLIGSAELRTISSGQLRRLSIGVEIVHNPMLIFLDEPTSGLDSYLAATVVEGMKTLALCGRTLLCAIHQPSAAVFHRFDKLLLLSQGHAIYFGPTSRCRTHFEALGYTFAQTNPADFALAVAHASAQASVMDTSEALPSEQPLYSTKTLANLMCDIKGSLHCIKETADVESCGTDASRTDIVSVEENPFPLNGAKGEDEDSSQSVVTAASDTDLMKSHIRDALLTDFALFLYSWPVVATLAQRDMLVNWRTRFFVSIMTRMIVLGVFLGIAVFLLCKTCF